MKIDVLTLFPDILSGPLSESILKRAQERKIVDISLTNIRDFSANKHNRVDDLPFGGGAGMVMQAPPVAEAIDSVNNNEATLVMMSPGGELFDQSMALELSKKKHLVFICGHYEGIDERVNTLYNPLNLSIGKFVLTNGAIAAGVVIDAVVRLLPGVLGNADSLNEESFSQDEMVEYPQYTRPREYRGLTVPDVLLSGNHREINLWRHKMAVTKTREFNNKQDTLKETPYEPGHRKT